MLDAILAKIFGTKNERELKAHAAHGRGHQRARTCASRQLSDSELAAKTAEFKERLAQGATARRPADRSLRRGPRGRPPRRRTCATSTCS